MGLDSVGTTQQPAPSGDGADVTDMVVRDLVERREAGTRKYGTPLRCHNGRNALVDLYQELLDSVLYARQLLAEAVPPEAGRETICVHRIGPHCYAILVGGRMAGPSLADAEGAATTARWLAAAWPELLAASRRPAGDPGRHS